MVHIQDEALELQPGGYVVEDGRGSVHRETCEGSVKGTGAVQHLGQYPLGFCWASFLHLFACLKLILIHKFGGDAD